MPENHITWPPPFIVKKHAKAKYVKLRTSQVHGLEITVPKRFSLKYLPDVLEQNRAWIIKQLTALSSEKVWDLPDTIALPSVNEIWKIFYVPCQTKLKLLHRPGNELVVMGQIANKTLCVKRLQRWVKSYAKVHLHEALMKVSLLTQLSYKQLSIRDQKTRWGSCTSQKNISLNYKLIFLPAAVMEYVMIHELCHTQYLNHSERFWQLVKRHDPHCDKHRGMLRQANAIIPSWVDVG